VVNEAGRLAGIVSRADLLKVFTRPDEAERSSLIPHLVRAVHHVEGVVRVEDRLGFDVDDDDPAIAFPWMGP
jgi:hypothetical protein